MDVNSEEIVYDSETENEKLSEDPVRCGVKVWIRRNKNGLGPGGYKLFSAIAEFGSVKKACAEISVSYSKGWTIIHGAEDELGIKIVERQQGGINGGEAHLSAEGKRLLELYEIYRKKVAASAEVIFDEVFAESGLF